MDISEIIERVKQVLDTHRLDGEGAFARWLWQRQGSEKKRKLGINEYGCADAANILYTIGEFPHDPLKRTKWINTLRNLQDPQSGLFVEETHHFIHTTAHCVAALELFDSCPLHPLTALLKYRNKNELYELLNGLDWENMPWNQSHQGAGIYAAMTITNSVDREWEQWYFDWLWDFADPETGFWKCCVQKNAPLYQYMAGGFHYLFNLESARIPVRYPEKIIDSCLDMYNNGKMKANFGKMAGFLEIDWVYCINRALRQMPHRFWDCKEALRKFAGEYVDYLYSLDVHSDEGFNDLHMLFGIVCALAELQQALPGELRAKRPLKLVLDRRPFI